MFAIAFNKTAHGFELGEVELVDATDIQPNDSRIFVAGEANVDWVAEALLTDLNKDAAQ